MVSIKKQWEEYEDAAVPKQAGAPQRMATRRAFYAGFSAAMRSLVQVADDGGFNDDITDTMIQRLIDECLEFAEQVLEGQA